mgnify:FL=1
MLENIFAKELTIIHQDGTIDNIFKNEDNQYNFLNYIINALYSGKGIFFHTLDSSVESWEGILYFPDFPTLEQEKVMKLVLELGKKMQSFCTRNGGFVFPFHGNALSFGDFDYPRFPFRDFKDWECSSFILLSPENHYCLVDTNDLIDPLIVWKKCSQENYLFSYLLNDYDRSLWLPSQLSFDQRSFLFQNLDYLNYCVKELFVGVKGNTDLVQYLIDHDLYSRINFSTEPRLVESLKRY